MFSRDKKIITFAHQWYFSCNRVFFFSRHCASVFPRRNPIDNSIDNRIKFPDTFPHALSSWVLGQGILSVWHCVSFLPIFPFNSPSIESLAQNVQFYGFIVFGILHGGHALPLSEYLLKRMAFEKLRQSKMLCQENIQRCIS